MKQRDLGMMLKRLRVYVFAAPIDVPRKIKPCGRCFAELLFGDAPKRKAEESARRDKGDSPPTKKAADWTIDQVVDFMHKLSLPADVEGRIRENAVDGELLCSLSRADLVKELGLSNLQAAKVLQRLK